MKKTIALLLAFTLSMLLLAGCGGNSETAGAMSGKYTQANYYEDPVNYLEFFEDGKCVLCIEGVEMNGTYTVDGDTITFQSVEFDDAEKGIIDGAMISHGERVFVKEQ